MTRTKAVQGELQEQVLAALWRIGEGTVEAVRSQLPPRFQGAHNTIQTVLNRLAERGLLSRARDGRAIVYQPRLTETEFLSRSIESALAGTSTEVRQAVLAQLVGGLGSDELAALRDLSRRAGLA